MKHSLEVVSGMELLPQTVTPVIFEFSYDWRTREVAVGGIDGTLTVDELTNAFWGQQVVCMVVPTQEKQPEVIVIRCSQMPNPDKVWDAMVSMGIQGKKRAFQEHLLAAVHEADVSATPESEAITAEPAYGPTQYPIIQATPTEVKGTTGVWNAGFWTIVILTVAAGMGIRAGWRKINQGPREKKK